MDNDETDIGVIENPPKPTNQLFYVSKLFDIIGLGLCLFISFYFFYCVLAYMLISRAYSFKGIRLKKYPIFVFLAVVFSKGAFTFWMVYRGINNNVVELNDSIIIVLIAAHF